MSKLSLILALTASLGAASKASASDAYFDASSAAAASQDLNVGYVHAPAAGTVEIYAFDGNIQGKLLGTETVTAGANNEVTVSVGLPYANKVLMVLDVDGQDVAQKVINLTDL